VLQVFLPDGGDAVLNQFKYNPSYTISLFYEKANGKNAFAKNSCLSIFPNSDKLKKVRNPPRAWMRQMSDGTNRANRADKEDRTESPVTAEATGGIILITCLRNKARFQ
jgi:hypothetical protein